jgi:hypothetical protein
VRGKAPVVDYDGRKISFITLFGEAVPDDLRFYISNADVTMATSAHVTFVPDMTLGTLRQPFVLHLSENGAAVYPNTFTRSLHLEFNASNAQKTTVVLTDMLGNEVYSQTIDIIKGLNRRTIEPEAPEGMYVLSVLIEGKRHTWKVIRR